MHRAVKVAADWLIAPNVQKIATRLYRRTLGEPIYANRQLHNRHADRRRCFVIGNGPSLKGLDLSPLAHEVTIGANSFYKHPSAEAMGLDYLCMGDPTFYADEPRVVEWHRIIEARMPQTTLITHQAAARFFAKHGLHAQREVYYITVAERPVHEASAVNLDFAHPLNIGQTTGTLIMIPLAMFLGFREIYLLGFDANWLEDLNASYHFYDQHEIFTEFDSVSTDGRGYSYEDELRAVHREFESHRLLHERAQQAGVSIINATAGGRVDVYPRKSLEEVLREVKAAEAQQSRPLP